MANYYYSIIIVINDNKILNNFALHNISSKSSWDILKMFNIWNFPKRNLKKSYIKKIQENFDTCLKSLEKRTNRIQIYMEGKWESIWYFIN